MKKTVYLGLMCATLLMMTTPTITFAGSFANDDEVSTFSLNDSNKKKDSSKSSSSKTYSGAQSLTNNTTSNETTPSEETNTQSIDESSEETEEEVDTKDKTSIEDESGDVKSEENYNLPEQSFAVEKAKGVEKIDSDTDNLVLTPITKEATKEKAAPREEEDEQTVVTDGINTHSKSSVGLIGTLLCGVLTAVSFKKFR